MCNTFSITSGTKIFLSSSKFCSAKLGFEFLSLALILVLTLSSFDSSAQLIDPNSDASIALSKKGKQSNWSYFASSRWSRPLISPAIETASFGLTASYSGLSKFLLTTNIGAYRSLVSESDDPDIDQSVTDLNASLVFKKSPVQTDFLTKRKISSMVSMGISLPTSENSRRNTLIGSVNGTVFFSKSIFKRYTLSTGLSSYLSAHRYENVRNPDLGNGLARGPFSYFGLSMPLSVSTSFLKGKGSVFLSYNIGTNLNYDQDWVGSNSVVTSVSYRVTKKLRVLGSYSWGDRIETDNEVFAYEAVRASAGISYKL